MTLMAASTARATRDARLRGRGWWLLAGIFGSLVVVVAIGEDPEVSGRRDAEAETDMAPGEDMEAGEEPLRLEEKMKGRPTKMSLR